MRRAAECREVSRVAVLDMSLELRCSATSPHPERALCRRRTRRPTATAFEDFRGEGSTCVLAALKSPCNGRKNDCGAGLVAAAAVAASGAETAVEAAGSTGRSLHVSCFTFGRALRGVFANDVDPAATLGIAMAFNAAGATDARATSGVNDTLRSTCGRAAMFRATFAGGAASAAAATETTDPGMAGCIGAPCCASIPGAKLETTAISVVIAACEPAAGGDGGGEFGSEPQAGPCRYRGGNTLAEGVGKNGVSSTSRPKLASSSNPGSLDEASKHGTASPDGTRVAS